MHTFIYYLLGKDSKKVGPFVFEIEGLDNVSCSSMHDTQDPSHRIVDFSAGFMEEVCSFWK